MISDYSNQKIANIHCRPIHVSECQREVGLIEEHDAQDLCETVGWVVG